MSRDPLKVGVLGVGHLGQHHARVLHEHPDSTLVGIYDTDPERAREVAGRHGVEVYSSPDRLLGVVDAVSIVVPTPAHGEVATPFLEAGKGVFVEKPLAVTLEEADRMVELSRKSGSVLQVGHIERFNPCIVAASKLVENPLFIECDRIHPFSARSTEVSVVLDLMIHDIDLVLHLARGKVTELDALGAQVLSPTEDLATARIVFDGGCTAMVKTSRVAMNRSRKIRVFSERQYLSLDLVAQKGMRTYLREGYDPMALVDAGGRLGTPEGEAAFIQENIRMEPIQITDREPLVAELETFIHAVQGVAPCPVDGAQGRRAMEAADRITHQIQANRERIQAARSGS